MKELASEGSAAAPRPVIAVDANPATRAAVTGTEHYARELSLSLAAAAPEFDWRWYAARPAPDLPLDLTVLPFRRLWSQVRLPVELSRHRSDLLFVPSHVVPFLARGPVLTVVHDLAFERFPTAYSRPARAYLRLTTGWAERRCSRLIAVSESTRRDLAELHGIDPNRVTVAYPGAGPEPHRPPDAAERCRALGLEPPFVLHVGRIERRKNQVAALAAIERLGGLKLVCAGAIVDEGIARRLRASPSCVVLGRVSAEDLEALYFEAELLLFPSLYEGFGFPILEAMRRDLPVVTARRSSLPEVGGPAALYVDDPEDDGALAGAAERLLDDRVLRQARIALGREQAEGFTWERCAATVAGVIRELLGRAAPGPARSSRRSAPS